MPPVKQYNSFIPKTNCTLEAGDDLRRMAAETGLSPAEIIRQAWEFARNHAEFYSTLQSTKSTELNTNKDKHGHKSQSI